MRTNPDARGQVPPKTCRGRRSDASRDAGFRFPTVAVSFFVLAAGCGDDWPDQSINGVTGTAGSGGSGGSGGAGGDEGSAAAPGGGGRHGDRRRRRHGRRGRQHRPTAAPGTGARAVAVAGAPAGAERRAAGRRAAGRRAAELAVAEPAVAEPAVAEPAVAELAVAEPAVAEPPVAEPVVAAQGAAASGAAGPRRRGHWRGRHRRRWRRELHHRGQRRERKRATSPRRRAAIAPVTPRARRPAPATSASPARASPATARRTQTARTARRATRIPADPARTTRAAAAARSASADVPDRQLPRRHRLRRGPALHQQRMRALHERQRLHVDVRQRPRVCQRDVRDGQLPHRHGLQRRQDLQQPSCTTCADDGACASRTAPVTSASRAVASTASAARPPTAPGRDLQRHLRVHDLRHRRRVQGGLWRNHLCVTNTCIAGDCRVNDECRAAAASATPAPSPARACTGRSRLRRELQRRPHLRRRELHHRHLPQRLDVRPQRVCDPNTTSAAPARATASAPPPRLRPRSPVRGRRLRPRVCRTSPDCPNGGLCDVATHSCHACTTAPGVRRRLRGEPPLRERRLRVRDVPHDGRLRPRARSATPRPSSASPATPTSSAVDDYGPAHLCIASVCVPGECRVSSDCPARNLHAPRGPARLRQRHRLQHRPLLRRLDRLPLRRLHPRRLPRLVR